MYRFSSLKLDRIVSNAWVRVTTLALITSKPAAVKYQAYATLGALLAWYADHFPKVRGA